MHVTGNSISAKSSPYYAVPAIAQWIAQLNPRLQPAQYERISVAVAIASEKYGVDPKLLVAIAHQETSFRENLPEGKAGEWGICQIRKNWLKDPRFIQEFGNKTEEELKHTTNNIVFAAWILKTLSVKARPSSIPFWSYYNAVAFSPRLRYFVSVNRHITRIEGGAMAAPKRSRIYKTILGRGEWKNPHLTQVSFADSDQSLQRIRWQGRVVPVKKAKTKRSRMIVQHLTASARFLPGLGATSLQD